MICQAFSRTNIVDENWITVLDRPYLEICFYYDIGLQCIFLIGLVVLEYRSFKIKSKFRGSYVEDYSITISGLPILHPYLIIPKVQKFLKNQLNSKFGLLATDIEIFDITSACAEQQCRHIEIKTELESRLSMQLHSDEES